MAVHRQDGSQEILFTKNWLFCFELGEAPGIRRESVSPYFCALSPFIWSTLRRHVFQGRDIALASAVSLYPSPFVHEGCGCDARLAALAL